MRVSTLDKRPFIGEKIESSLGKIRSRSFAWHLALATVWALALDVPGQDIPSPAPAPDASNSAQASSGGISTSTTPSTAINYKLKSGDLIRITVFGEDDLTTEVRIPQSGSIMFPLLGPVVTEGKTVADAQEQIRSQLAKNYIKQPNVNVTVLDYAKLYATVSGEVQKSGNVEIPTDGGLDLLGALAVMGGTTDNADATHISVRRNVNNQEVVLTVNATDLARNPDAKPFMIEPGDTITVPYVKKWLTILGEVRAPGKINLPPEGDLDLLGALALAGGYTPDADPDHVDIRRTIDGRDSILTVNATQLARDPSVKAFIVQPGDSITVKFAAQVSITIMGEVRSPGKVRIPPVGGLDLLSAVALAGGFTADANLGHITVRRSVEGKDNIITVNAKDLSNDSSVGTFMVQPNDIITVPERMF